MCGIAGIVDFRGGHLGMTLALAQMRNSMVHRGPDEEGDYSDGKVHLTHRRLRIIDISSGQQPMMTEDGQFVCVFNGEIYNFLQIRKVLERLGHSFKTRSDTEVLLKSYVEWGTDCLDKFIGMFAFAIYDKKRNLVFFARDRLGIKPFYYHTNRQYFAFASEIKALLNSGLISGEVETGCIDFYMSLGYVPAPKTMFKNILKLKPGHYGILKDDGKVQIIPYWSLRRVKQFEGTFQDARDELEYLLKNSTALHLISDVPVGVFLSGGVDSATVVAVICKKLRRSISTFSIGYSDFPEFSELDKAEIIAKRYNTDHHPIILSHEDFFESLDSLIFFTEEPIVEAAAIALLQLSKHAKQFATVLLSGEGGDEVFAGYPLYRIMKYTELVRRIMPQRILEMGYLRKTLSRTEKYKKYFDWIRRSLENKYWGISNDVTRSVKTDMYQKDTLNQAEDTEAFFLKLLDDVADKTDLQKMQYVDMNTWLPDDLLLKADKMTMAASIELRVPFLDHRIVEFGFSLPDRFKVRMSQQKYIIRNLMYGELPYNIINQKKKGFPTPLPRWFRTKLYGKVRDILLDDRCVSRGYFKPEYIRGVLRKHKDGTEDLSRRILSLLVLELWHRKYID